MRATLHMVFAAALVAAANPLAAQGRQDFTLVNATGYDIAEVYVAPSASDNWEEDVMGRDILSAGQSVDIGFPPRDKVCIYDLKVVYTDAEEAEWDRFDLCSVSRITIYYNRRNGETWAEYE